jgi:hypothetical protein
LQCGAVTDGDAAQRDRIPSFPEECRMTEKPVPQQGELDLAFRIHQDSDMQLHHRLNTFVISQSFLVIAYGNILHNVPPIFEMAEKFMIPALGLIFSLIYYKYCMRLVRGIEYLKQAYLVPPEGVYANYIRTARGIPSGARTDLAPDLAPDLATTFGPLKYSMAQPIILAMAAFWLTVVGIALYGAGIGAT